MEGEMAITRRGVIALPALASLPMRAFAAETVKIGYIEALTGNAAAAGQSIKQAAELALDIINNPHPELAPLTLATKTGGLTNLGGAKVEIVWADNQGSPAVAQSDAVRLITQDHVVALSGAYQSSCTLTSSAVAERYGIPYVAGESAAANLTERGYKWFFRTTPYGPDFARLYLDFLAAVAKLGTPTGKIAVVHENTDYGTSVADSMVDTAAKRGIKVALRIAYNANGTDVSPQVLQLKGAKPDVVIFISYTSDSILYLKTMKTLDFRPPIVIGDDFGLLRPVLRQDRRHHRARGAEPQRLRARQAGQPDLQDQRVVQETDRARPGRYHRALDARLPGAVRRHQPGRLDQARRDPRGAGQDRPAGKRADDQLQRGEVQRPGPERACLFADDPTARRSVHPGLADRPGRRQARIAVQGLGLTAPPPGQLRG